ncbi:MAG: shikimate dehydrogenase [Candidatus Binatia bacterium]
MLPTSITGQTRLLGVLADPVAQARSPGMANTLLHEQNLFGEYVLVPLHVSAGGLPQVIDGLRHLRNFAGTIVSMPHKSTVVSLLDEISPEVSTVGAVNVIRRELDGRLLGAIFDGEGFVSGLWGAGYAVQGKTCLLAGAGGAAAAVAFSLAKHGCTSLTIINRTKEKAVTLASRVQHTWPHLPIHTELSLEKAYDVAINATSLGMHPGDALPLPVEVVESSSLIAECVIAPEITPLLEIARTKGRTIHTGVPMLAAQMDLMLRFMRAGNNRQTNKRLTRRL